VSILEELAVIYRKGSGTYIMEKFIENNNLNVPKSRAYGNEAVKQAVMAGLGCSIMPLIGVKNELNNGLQIVPVKVYLLELEFNMAEGKKFSPVATAYLDFFKLKSVDLF
jgi:DNA-binding transcriptional LysR family regulator